MTKESRSHPVAEYAPIQGAVMPGFEHVRDVFAANFDPALPCPDVGAAFCVIRDGETVVDLWGGFSAKDQSSPWQRDTLVNTYSTSKGISASCTTLLEARGVLHYDTPVAHYWPAFGQNGKADITLGQLLSHQAGLSGLRETLTVEDLFDQEKMATLLAHAEPLWAPGSTAGYHALTWGHLVAQIVRLTTGMSIGRFLQQEIAVPLEAQFFLGLQPSQPVANMIAPPGTAHQTQAELSEIVRLTLLNPPVDPLIANRTDFRAAELPALGGAGSAHGIATIYNALLGGPLFPAGAFERACHVRFAGVDINLGVPVRWGAGFYGNNVRRWYGPNDSAFGHSGWGGSIGYADPDQRLAIGFVVNQMDADLNGDPRAVRLVDAVQRCL
jgi:CubicO group peptidase (beta-lactamase class C family)